MARPGPERAARGTPDTERGGGAEGGPAIPRPRLGVVTGGRAAGDDAGTATRSGRSSAGGAAAGTTRDRRTGKASPETTAAVGRTAAQAEAAARRQAEAEERLAREAAERAAHRREQYADAERLVASTAAAAADALGCEDRLEAEVRDLEERLTRTRADLAAARMQARHAEAAERRARQALDRLPPP